MIKKYSPAPSNSRFFIPRTLASDFEEFLSNDIPGAVMDFTIYKDWYEQFSENYEKTSIRGEIYPDATKSRYSNTDNNLNFRASMDSGIKKGDMIVDPENNIYILDWEVPPEPGNRMSRALRCNSMLTFKRHQAEEVDDDGFLIHEGGDIVVANAIPCNAYRHDGRLEFSVYANSPGLMPNAITLISMQFNEQTKNVKVDDTFEWGPETYTVADVNLVGVDIHGTSGVIQLQAKKKSGGTK